MKQARSIFWYVHGEPGDPCPLYRVYIHRSRFEAAGIRCSYFFPAHLSYGRIRRMFSGIFSPWFGGGRLTRFLASFCTELARPFMRPGYALWKQVPLIFADTVVFQRVPPDPRLLRLLQKSGKKLFYDLDDALFLVPPSKDESSASDDVREDPGMVESIRRTVKACSAVIVSNDYLKAHLGRWHPETSIVPTACPVPTQFLSKTNPPGSVRVVGWMGAVENQRYLRPLLPVFELLGRAFPDLEIRLVTRDHWDYDGRHIRKIRWEPETWEREASEFEIGMAPLADNGWTRGKMQFKALQYAARGTPVVASRVGFNLDHWKHGENILFADKPDEWLQALTRLLTETAEARRLGEAGRETVRRHYAPEVVGPVLKEILTVRTNGRTTP